MNSLESMGRRERNKHLKRERILSSACRLFRERGYDRTTTREISSAAEVAAGTLFSYARDKRDVILMIINDELGAVVADYEPAAHGGTIEDRLVDLFRPFYEFFARERAIAMAGLREISTIGPPGEDDSDEILRLRARRELTRSRIAEILAGQPYGFGGEMDEESAAIALNMIVAIQNDNVRAWLIGGPSEPEAGLDRLRKKFEIIVRGLPQGSD